MASPAAGVAGRRSAACAPAMAIRAGAWPAPGCPPLPPSLQAIALRDGRQLPSPCQPLRDLFLRIRARFGVGAEMAAVGRRCVDAAGERVQRRIGAVEIM